MKTLRCKDLGFDCPGVIQAEREEEVLEHVASLVPLGRPRTIVCPAWSVLERRSVTISPPCVVWIASIVSATSSLRRNAPAKPITSSAWSRLPSYASSVCLAWLLSI